ncbi:GntR family transcriptional regulator [Nocardiopsis sp. RSe5-2]|uniref:GntR family transcriptional regulator n=1 Tax=Nocardiopsis endophytica TaxID=3018445 RepID=A0ABT4UAU6_9ACTN|nr:GntR family transcriptional regulator [Nocardiopsis endophytica]MDA2814043.1 GntR family transcriptional regulator [Nocardiopsis endophytica]
MTTPSPPPLKPVSLRQQAREAVRTRIVLGRIEPGEVVSVAAVAAELGVSVTPVREAVMDLAHLGMVEVIRNRGFRVPPLSDHDLDEIFTLRTMLEAPAMAEVARTHVAAALAPFRELAAAITEAAREGDLEAFLDRDRRFHLGLLEMTGNRRLVAMVGQLRDQARMKGLQRLADQGELTGTAQEHEAIVEAVAARDADLTAELTRRHLAHSRGIWAGIAENEG